MSWKPRSSTPAIEALVSDLEGRHPGLAAALARGRPSELSRRYFLTTAQITRLRAQLYLREGKDEPAPRGRVSPGPRPRRPRAPVAPDLPTLAPLKRPSAVVPDHGPDAVRRDAEARWPGLVGRLARLHDGGVALLYGLNASRVAWIRLKLGVPRPPRHPADPEVWAVLPMLLAQVGDRALAEAFQVPEPDVRRLRAERGIPAPKRA